MKKQVQIYFSITFRLLFLGLLLLLFPSAKNKGQVGKPKKQAYQWSLFQSIEPKKTFSVIDKSSFRANLGATRFLEKKLIEAGYAVLLQPEAIIPTPQMKREERRRAKELELEKQEAARRAAQEQKEREAEELAQNKTTDGIPADLAKAPVKPSIASPKHDVSESIPNPEPERPKTDYTFEISYKLYESRKDYAAIDALSTDSEISLINPATSRFLCEQFIAHLFWGADKQIVALFAFESEWVPKDLRKIVPLLLEKLEENRPTQEQPRMYTPASKTLPKADKKPKVPKSQKQKKKSEL